MKNHNTPQNVSKTARDSQVALDSHAPHNAPKSQAALDSQNPREKSAQILQNLDSESNALGATKTAHKSIIHQIFAKDKAGQITLYIIGAVVLYVGFANLFLPQDSPFYISSFIVSLLGKYLAFALLALSLDLVWGYLGILSLGQGVFFALGGYAMAMHLSLQNKSQSLPDFMLFMDWNALPWYWAGSSSFVFTIFLVLFVPSLLAFVFGYLTFKSRVSGVYFSIITQCLAYALMLAFLRNDMGFGGNNGLTDFKEILGFSLQNDKTRVGLLFASAIALILGYILARSLMNSRYGKACVAIRDLENRLRFLGYKVTRYKLFLFVLACAMAGVAGALYVPQVGIINPNVFSPLFSIELVIWVAIGGRASLYGAIIGAIVVSLANTILTSALPEAWLFVLGASFVLVTLFLPKGLIGLYAQIKGKIWKQS